MEKNEILNRMAEILRENGYKVDLVEEHLPTIEDFVKSSNLSSRAKRVIKSYYIRDRKTNDISVLIKEVKSGEVERLRDFGPKSINELRSEIARKVGMHI